MRTTVGITSRVFLPEPAAASFRLGAIAEALTGDGAGVCVITAGLPPGTPAGAVQPETAAKVKRFPVLRDETGYVRGYLPYLSFDIPLFFRLLFAPRFNVLLVEPPPTSGFVARLACSLRRVPYVWYAADVWSDATEAAGAPGPVVKAVRALERFAVRGASGIIAVSDGVGDRVRELGGKNIRVVPNGIDTGTYSTAAVSLSASELAELGITAPYVLYAGTASEWQGARVFAQAMTVVAGRDPNLQLVYVGQGSEWGDIKNDAEELRKKLGREAIVQLPTTTPEMVSRLLAGAEAAMVSIVPGKGYDFAYPTKVLAALASGKPVLFAGNGPVARDLLSYDLGLACRYDVGAVAEGILALTASARQGRSPGELRCWVKENRSMAKAAEEAACFILEVAAREEHR